MSVNNNKTSSVGEKTLSSGPKGPQKDEFFSPANGYLSPLEQRERASQLRPSSHHIDFCGEKLIIAITQISPVGEKFLSSGPQGPQQYSSPVDGY